MVMKTVKGYGVITMKSRRDMLMMIVAKIGFAMAMFASLTGCQAESPSFVGKWVEQGSSGRAPHTLEISKDHGVYTVAEAIPIGGIVKTVHDVAKVESDTVLSVKNGMRSLILQDGILSYRSKTFVKTPI